MAHMVDCLLLRGHFDLALATHQQLISNKQQYRRPLVERDHQLLVLLNFLTGSMAEAKQHLTKISVEERRRLAEGFLDPFFLGG